MNIIKKHPWLIFALGLILGFLIFTAYNYIIQHQQQNEGSEQVTQPVSFQIGPENHTQGNLDAPVSLVVFNDFTCPYCQDYALALEELMKDYSQQALLVWKHFPLNLDYLSPAIASECADEQGQFWEFAQELYRHQGNFDNNFYLATAAKLNLDLNQFTECLASDKYTAKVQADYYEGIIKGVIGAPATFVNGEYIVGAIPLERLKEIVEELL